MLVYHLVPNIQDGGW